MNTGVPGWLSVGAGQGRGGSESLAGKKVPAALLDLSLQAVEPDLLRGPQALLHCEVGSWGLASGDPSPGGPAIHKAGLGVMAWEERQGWGAWAEGPQQVWGVLETPDKQQGGRAGHKAPG